MFEFWWIKSIGGPGSLGFLLVVAAIALLLMAISRRTRRAGRRLVILLTATYFLLSLPIVASTIAGHSPSFDIATSASLEPVDDVFVFDGDNYEARAVMTATLTRAINVRAVWILGYGDLRDALVANKVQDDLLRWGYTDGNATYGQVTRMKALMERHKTARAVVVASRIQAERIRGLLQHHGVKAAIVASPMNSEPTVTGVLQVVPSLSALALSRDGLYERAARLYYRWRGWI